jgi:hypothetical protein
MTYEPTPKQTLILWDVLARGGSAAQADIPFKVEPKDREALVKARLLATTKIGRSLWLTVEDAGWSWADDHLDAPLAAPAAPKKAAKNPVKAAPAPPKIPTLQVWLTRLHAFLRARRLSLADVLPQVPPPAPQPKPKASRKPRLATLADRISAAVARLQGSPQRDGLRLSALRAALPDIDRAVLDDALVQLFEEAKINLMSLSNPPDIERERPACVRYKGQELQVLWMKR